ncbi:MAG: 4Fe-4S dicluster domain-containing protein [Elusimicrobia bacterium]|nr:4Fe-4S dicluster domain-containing protein [Elusimicrobiota bacterium]
MPKLDRRDFLKTALTLGAGAAGLPSPARAARVEEPSPERMGVLVDATACIGCRNCEWACKDAHGLPTPPLESYQDDSVFAAARRPDTTALTVVNRVPNPKSASAPFGVKVQCMHCDRPACVSACIVGALKKREDGAVVWDTDRCIGCRYCMIACPFQIPSFEYKKALQGRIMKCDFCAERRDAGGLPACVERCPVEALTYGRRSDLVHAARERARRAPERYADHVYGEAEVGGTSWLYLAGKDAPDLGFPKLGRNPAPGVSESIQEGVFAYFVPPLSLYSLLGLLMWVSKRGPGHGDGEEP